MLRSFSGYRGVAALMQIGEVKFLVVARNADALAEIWPHLFPNGQPFNPGAVQPSIVISSKLLPEPKAAVRPTNDHEQAG